MMAPMASFMQILILTFTGGGNSLNLPVGLPPTAPDSKMAQVAPDTALLYLSWSGTAEADPKSGNRTEAMLAEPQVKEMFTRIEKTILDFIAKNTANDPEEEQLLGKHIPPLIKMALLNPSAVYLQGVTMGPEGVGVDAAVVINCGKQINQAKQSMDALEGLLVKALGGGKVETLPADQGGLRKLPLPEGAPLVAYGFEGNYLIIASGKQVARVPEIIKNGKGNGPKWLAQINKDLAIKRQSSVSYINAGELLKRFGPMLSQEMGGQDGGQMFNTVVKALGGDKLTHIASVTGFDNKGFVTKSKVAVPKDASGLFKLISDKPLAAADLSDIPADADLAMALRLDSGAIFDELRKVIGAIDTDALEEFDEELADTEEEIGFSVRKDLLASLGDVVSIYNSPGQGGLIITGLTGVVRVKDHAKAKDVLAKIVKLTDEEFNGHLRNNNNNRRWGRREYQFKSIDFQGEKITYINPIGDDWVVAPAWCLTKDRFIIAPYPQMVKAYLMHQKKAGPTLATVKEIKSQLDTSDGVSMISFVDTKGMFKKAYPLLHGLATVGFAEMQREGIDLDVSILPTSSAILPHLSSDVSSVTRRADGIYSEARSSLPLAGMSALTSAALILPVAAMSRREMTEPAPDGAKAGDETGHNHSHGDDQDHDVVLPSAQKQRKAMTDLRQIGIAVFLYHATNNKAPNTLTDLNGKGIKIATKDPWGQPYIYLGKGKTPAGANSAKTPFAAASQLSKDGKRLVLYGDGHVELIADAAFKKQLKAAGIKFTEPARVPANRTEDATSTTESTCQGT